MRVIDNIKVVQDVLFDTLCYLDDFCKKNNISYFLSNGTLLGAVKYGGFIPWDDDVDVIVPREDYDRLVRLAEINTDKYRLLCKEQITEWRMPYAKLSFDDTYLKEGEYNFGVELGISIDIFPIDNWCPCLYIAKIQAFRGECLKRLLVCSIGGTFNTKKKGLSKIILRLIWIIGKKIGYEYILERINKSIEKSKKREKKYVGCVSWTCHFHKDIFPANYLEKTEYTNFRGRLFPVFSEYKRYLDNLYGDWMSELPPERRCSNHDIKVWWKDE